MLRLSILITALAVTASAAFAQELPSASADTMLRVCIDQRNQAQNDTLAAGSQALQLAAENARLKKEIEELKKPREPEADK